MDNQKLTAFVEEAWPAVQSTLETYITIPNQSPMFDNDWATNGLQEKVVDLFVAWVKAQNVKGLTLEVIKDSGRTPLIFIEVASTGGAGTVLLYGHLDKQPPMESAWDKDLHPYKPVVKDGKLYGRGGADDGYSIFGSILSLMALQAQGIPHGRAVVMIEACEESGSPDLPHYVYALQSRIGTPSLIVCLDSGCGNYEQMWITTNLRGLCGGNLTTTILKEGVHSGSSSGVVPSSFRITRMLLSRVEEEATGRILLPELHCPIPPDRLAEAKVTSGILGESIYKNFPFVEGAGPAHPEDQAELLLRRTWRPALSITGASGFPTLEQAGNVLRTHSSFKLSMRLPPRVDAKLAGVALKAALEAHPPYGSKVVFDLEKSASGWDAPPSSPWLSQAVEQASKACWGKPPAYFGEGGSIPFMGMLGEMFPLAQFIVTGVLGPGSNAHGPNEFLHIGFTKKLIAAVSIILEAHGKQVAQPNGGVSMSGGAMEGRVAAANADREATLAVNAAKAHNHIHKEGCCP